MAETKFTPGPWRWLQESPDYPSTLLVGPDYKGDAESLRGVHGVVMEVYESHGGGEMPEDENASLIAAAPDLYASLQALVNEVNATLSLGERKLRQAVGHTNVNVLHLKVDEAVAALAQARGED